MKKIILLTSDGPQGHDLAKQLTILAHQQQFELKPVFGFTLAAFFSGFMKKRLQIIDISMDEDPLVYDKVHPIHTLNHLYVSRTHTPLNFRPMAIPIRHGEELINAFPEFGEMNSNDEIRLWLEQKLPKFVHQRQSFIPIIGRLLDMKRNSEERKNEIRKEGSIFLSYRSSENQSIAALARQIESKHEKRCRFFAPGVISHEAMSRMRRWNLLSLLDRYILSADEIWTCLSDDYFYSWWTFGEFLMAVHRQTANDTGHKPLLKKYRNGAPEEWQETEWPEIMEAEHRRISRYFAFCDSFQMGPEALISHEGIQNLKLKFAEGYYRDDVWKKDFWLNPIVECPVCRKRSGPYNKRPIEEFLWHGQQKEENPSQRGIIYCGNGIIEIDYACMPSFLDQGITCRCGHTIRLKKGPMQYLHVFLPPKGQVPFSAARELARKWEFPEASVIGNNLIAIDSYCLSGERNKKSKQWISAVLQEPE